MPAIRQKHWHKWLAYNSIRFDSTPYRHGTLYPHILPLDISIKGGKRISRIYKGCHYRYRYTHFQIDIRVYSKADICKLYGGFSLALWRALFLSRFPVRNFALLLSARCQPSHCGNFIYLFIFSYIFFFSFFFVRFVVWFAFCQLLRLFAINKS